MKVLTNQQAITYLTTKEPDQNTAGFFYSSLERVWIAFNGCQNLTMKQNAYNG